MYNFADAIAGLATPFSVALRRFQRDKSQSRDLERRQKVRVRSSRFKKLPDPEAIRPTL